MRVRGYLVCMGCAAALAIGASQARAQAADVEVGPDGVRVEVGGRDTPRETQHDTGEAHAHAPRGGSIVRLSDIQGLDVHNRANEDLGDIQDLVIDTSSGKIRYAVVSFGGVLGIGDKYFAIPWEKLSFVSEGTTSAGTSKKEHVVLDLPKEVLENAPGFNQNQWPNFADRSWSNTIDQYYKMERQARTPGTERRE
ncbi:MAG: PRC-barrel domain-containing protein [Planctomycetota bacterium]